MLQIVCLFHPRQLSNNPVVEGGDYRHQRLQLSRDSRQPKVCMHNVRPKLPNLGLQSANCLDIIAFDEEIVHLMPQCTNGFALFSHERQLMISKIVFVTTYFQYSHAPYTFTFYTLPSSFALIFTYENRHQ